MSDLKRTPLRDFHAAHGARLVDFAGWEMPVQYRSILEEHKAVRRAAGLFDVSHMGEVDVAGPGAGAFLDSLVTNAVGRMYPGRVLYSPMCAADAGVIDDLLVYMRGPGDYFLCINAGNIPPDLEWIRARAAGQDVRSPTAPRRPRSWPSRAAGARDRPAARRDPTRGPEVLPFHAGRGRRRPLHHQPHRVHRGGRLRALPRRGGRGAARGGAPRGGRAHALSSAGSGRATA